MLVKITDTNGLYVVQIVSKQEILKDLEKAKVKNNNLRIFHIGELNILLTSYYEQGYSNPINIVAIDNRYKSNPARGIIGGISSDLAFSIIGFTLRLRYSI